MRSNLISNSTPKTQRPGPSFSPPSRLGAWLTRGCRPPTPCCRTEGVVAGQRGSRRVKVLVYHIAMHPIRGNTHTERLESFYGSQV